MRNPALLSSQCGKQEIVFSLIAPSGEWQRAATLMGVEDTLLPSYGSSKYILAESAPPSFFNALKSLF